MVSSQPISGKLLGELLIGITVNAEIPSVTIRNITSNSRQVESNSLFVALEGTQTHGIDFAIDAAKSGAAIILYDAMDDYCLQRIPLLRKQVKTCWLGVNNLNRLNGEIVSRFYGDPSQQMTVIGVTGTDGKTSVTHLLTQALSRLGHTVASIGTLGYGIDNQLVQTTHTTPDAVTLQSYLYEFQQKACKYVVMEVSSHALAQYRVSGCQIDIAVLTNLGRDHLDYHQSVEQYAAAKAKLFNEFELSGRVLNLNDNFGRLLAASNSNEQSVRYSSNQHEDPDVEVKLAQRVITDQGQDIRATTSQGDIIAQTCLMGEFNIDNTLACIACLISLGFGRVEISQAVAELKPIPGRMEKFSAGSGYPTVVIDFAHTEQALHACLQTSRQHTRGKLWCVFGCGGDRDPGKRAGMGHSAEQLADRVIITDDNPRTEPAEQIVRDILLGMDEPKQVSVVHSRQAAIEFALAGADAEDLVVIAGKGHEQEQIIGCERLPFSDRHVVQRIMKVGQ